MEMEVPLMIAAVLAGLSGVVLLADAVTTLRGRRRRRGTGAVGAVVDSEGNTLGIYVDPWTPPRTSARVHHEDSPWTAVGPEGRRGWAWEGFGETAEEALEAANHLRRRHLKLFPWLSGADVDDDEEGELPF